MFYIHTRTLVYIQIQMVKNTHGGNAHKKFGRKHVVASAGGSGGGGGSGSGLRVSKCSDEKYAVVVRLLGNGMFHCQCIDGVQRLGHVRGKFAGRGKRDNAVRTGTWVLMGLREWDNAANSKKIQHCDLLEVYSDVDKMRLIDTICEPWSRLRAAEESTSAATASLKRSEGGSGGGGGSGRGEGGAGGYDDNYVRFATESELEREKLVQDMCAGVLGDAMSLDVAVNASKKKGGMGIGMGDDDDDDDMGGGVFDLDDI